MGVLACAMDALVAHINRCLASESVHHHLIVIPIMFNHFFLVALIAVTVVQQADSALLAKRLPTEAVLTGSNELSKRVPSGSSPDDACAAHGGGGAQSSVCEGPIARLICNTPNFTATFPLTVQCGRLISS